MKRIGVLISGRGTNLQALIDAQERGDFNGEIIIVISNKSKAQGLQRAESAGIQTRVVTKIDYPKREDHDRAVIEILKEHAVDLVVLAGYMRILTPFFCREYKNRMINVHPSLLPAFKGVKAQWQAVEYGVKVSGCTTHFVEVDMDAGPIILQTPVEVRENDTGESLADKILPQEHRILVESVRLFCEDRLSVDGRLVRIGE
ncbi:phosphoribosylglycinamide formyltransferase [Candidatus Thorarchaeota archaeon]|nr:MAG: phosphoribosylglycinamide formyltransferase [Candidatus Thorarchaeota archaeon]